MKHAVLFFLVAVAAAVSMPADSHASGLLMPRGGTTPLEIESQVVDAVIDNQIARTHVTQVFRNPSNRTLEATYVFTLPEGAAVSEFAMWTNGVRRPAILAPRDEARRIYEQVIRTRKDPGLLEQTGARTFQMRVFPILPGAKQKIELVFDQTLAVENGTCRFVYPLRMEGTPVSRVKEDFTVNIRIRSAIPIDTVYSPSHSIHTFHTDDEIVIGLEEAGAALDRDFLLFYKPRFDKLGFRVVAEKRPGQDGTFVAMVSPGTMEASGSHAKDLVLLMDTSGSMKGEKIELAKQAMRFFVNSLDSGDRFNILTFSNEVRAFRPGFVGFDRKMRDEALAFIDSIVAGGGTAIDAALTRALADVTASGSDARPRRVIFVTDGKPTVGERDSRKIIEHAVRNNKGKARVFSFGVETAIDSALLNQLAAKTGGSAELVAPGEDLEVRISEFVVKYRKPVLSDISIRVDGVRAHDIYPVQPPDLFHGGQVRISGRYASAGSAVIRVSGNYLGKRIELVEEVELPKISEPRSQLRRLWAREKIGFLLDEIWWHGEAAELKSEICSLSRSASVLSPYTAMLLLETEADYRRFNLEPPRETLEHPAQCR